RLSPARGHALKKAELLQWHEAVTAFDKEDFNKALELFGDIAESAKINFNIGVILAGFDDHEGAVRAKTYGRLRSKRAPAVNAYIEALKLDQYFAVAYFQKGVSNFLLRKFEEALDDFNDAHLVSSLPLGSAVPVSICEAAICGGLCHAYLDKEEEATADLAAANNERQTPDHDVVSRALEEGIDGLGVFTMPQGLLYRPPEAKVKNVNKVDYLGSSKLIAAVERSEMFTGFKGAHLRKLTVCRIVIAPAKTAQNGEGDSAVSAPPSLQRSATVAGSSDGSSLAYRNNQFTRRALREKPMNDNAGGQVPNRNDGQGGGVSDRPVGLRRRATDATLPTRQNTAQPLLARANTSATIGRNNRAPSLVPLVTTNLPSSPHNSPTVRSSAGASSENGSASPGAVFAFDSESGKSLVLKVKCHYSDTRVVVVNLNATFAQLSERIQQKFCAPKPLILKYKDEDGELVLMTDQEDMDLARGIHLGSSGGSASKLEVWCFS
ncbi:MAG: hypothetical protein BJ554DRAFT_5431, partial [Olpidium bornovanus]